MSTSFFYFILGCWIFFSIAQVTEGIICYQCSGCGSNQNSWGTTNILATSAACFKYDYKVNPIAYANRGVQTPCSPGSDGLGGTNYCCSTDYCNSSVSLSTSLISVFALLMLLFMRSD